MSEWLAIGPLSSFPLRGARVVKSEAGDIAIFRTGDDNLFALRDHCPHKGGPLSQGLVYEHKVACPLHNWSIDLASGEAMAPDEGCAGHFKVKVDDGVVLLSL